MQTHFLLSSLEDTTQLAQNLGGILATPQVIALTGDLGSGKTTFIQQLGRVLGVSQAITSPTFGLIHEYETTNSHRFVHGDLYRLDSREAIAQLGLSDYFTQPNTITAVEWADRAPTLFPLSTIWISFNLLPDRRIATITSKNPHFWPTFEELL